MSRGGPSGGGGGGEDQNAYNILWIVGAIAVVCALIWYFGSEHLKQAFIILRRYELFSIRLFLENRDLNTAHNWLAQVTPALLNMDGAQRISTFIGEYLKYPVSFILLIMGIIMWRGHAGMRFNKVYDMNALLEQEKDNWPQISPVADVNLVEEDIGKGPWAMSENAMQFARRHQLLKVEMVANRKAMWRGQGVAQATVMREPAMQVFSNQLGPLWIDVNHLPPHTKAMYAAFLARIEHDTPACMNYLKKLSINAARGITDYSDTDVYLKKFGSSRAAQLCQSRHAYVLTVMASMLTLARIDGVLASSDFLWIKPIDRRLWYILNCVGRQVAVPEIGGVFAHWLAEKEMLRPLSVPMVDEATNALEKAVASMLYQLEDDEIVPVSGEQSA